MNCGAIYKIHRTVMVNSKTKWHTVLETFKARFTIWCWCERHVATARALCCWPRVYVHNTSITSVYRAGPLQKYRCVEIKVAAYYGRHAIQKGKALSPARFPCLSTLKELQKDEIKKCLGSSHLQDVTITRRVPQPIAGIVSTGCRVTLSVYSHVQRRLRCFACKGRGWLNIM